VKLSANLTVSGPKCGRCPERSRQSQITTDPDTIRSWSETRELVPVRYEDDGERRLGIVRESDRRAGHEELSWDEFETEMRQRGKLVVRHPEEKDGFDVVDRSELIEFTERTVVEHTIVQGATIQSQVAES